MEKKLRHFNAIDGRSNYYHYYDDESDSDMILHIDHNHDDYWDSLWSNDNLWDNEPAIRVHDQSLSTKYEMKCPHDLLSICACKSPLSSRVHSCLYSNHHRRQHNPSKCSIFRI